MSNKKPVIAALIVAAGAGERFGASLPKQYQPLLGIPVLKYNINKLSQIIDINNIYVVINPLHELLFIHATQGMDLPPPVTGGATRQETVRRGLEAIAASDAAKPDYVLIHDAARPGLSVDLIRRICDALAESDAAIPALPVADTLRRLQPDGRTQTESREKLYSVQTPQGFRFELIHGLHQSHADTVVTDDAALCELAGHAVTLVAGEKDNFKITEADDLARMEQALANRCGDIRTGTGYDVHRLIPPPDDLRRLMICGIAIPHDKVLEGHSDADVGLHAVTDALLGTICDGDIGMHFSPKDARWKNADSAAFLRHAADLIAARGGVVTHVDLTLICEAPKIGPHRDKMRARMAEILCLPESRISLKATTTEGLGFTGRGEGIAAQAVATVRLPFTPAIQMAAATEDDDTRKWGT
ncbi:MAG: bifunctional 2-C-methyl-D-erythritol 4-phosphate cytidylyltransferase/2-C-methyl-D-erythritol 2,4-cyclodiphosphate synthase [Alphaproteobacteria bacterium]|nr:bifunctional 2-C-methyl-D-erythritol 4-phosphate cytidylyltransferase/2-C-methyl-D-erythritol 2,4-cyclodiphosphate synthase [Alphaproteobacteria bacterium]